MNGADTRLIQFVDLCFAKFVFDQESLQISEEPIDIYSDEAYCA